MAVNKNPYDDVTLNEALNQLYERFNDRTIRQAIFVMQKYLGGGGGGGSEALDELTERVENLEQTINGLVDGNEVSF